VDEQGVVLSRCRREVEREQVQVVFSILQEWFCALENGIADHWLPDPSFVTPPGRPSIDDALVEEFVSQLDREIDTDAFGSRGQWYKADASSEFHRLAHPQRIALIQSIMKVLLTEEETNARAEAMAAARISSTEVSPAD